MHTFMKPMHGKRAMIRVRAW